MSALFLEKRMENGPNQVLQKKLLKHDNRKEMAPLSSPTSSIVHASTGSLIRACIHPRTYQIQALVLPKCDFLVSNLLCDMAWSVHGGGVGRVSHPGSENSGQRRHLFTDSARPLPGTDCYCVELILFHVSSTTPLIITYPSFTKAASIIHDAGGK